VIRNAVIHIINEQPLLADLYELPSPTDVGLRCTNLRTMDGRRPIFVDRSESVFIFPYLHIRFVEVPPSDVGLVADGGGEAESMLTAPPEAGNGAADTDIDLEIDEDFLRRVREA
jgi:hypothetical protein